MTAGSEQISDALAASRAGVWALLLERRPEAASWHLVQWGYVLEEPAIGRSSSERLGGLDAGSVISGDLILDETRPGGVWGHWRKPGR